jgi:acyl carrier protein
MSLSKKQQQLAFELVCAHDHKLATALREAFTDSDRLTYLEKRTALSSSGLSINPNMYQKPPAKTFSFMWRFECTDPKPSLRAAIDDAAKNYPLPDVDAWDEDHTEGESVCGRLNDAAYEKMVREIHDMVSCTIGSKQFQSTFADMGADNLDMVDLTLSIEQHFELEIPDADVDLWKTTQDVINYVQRRISEVKK